MTNDSALPTFHFSRGTSIAQAEPRPIPHVTPTSPALDVMTDLTTVRAATTTPDATLLQAEQLMIHQGVRLLFVVSAMPSVAGLITATDLQGDKPMRVVQQRNVHHDEVTVADVMTELAHLDAVQYDDLRHATVSNVIATMKKVGRHHLLVVQGSGKTESIIRGVISSSQVERQLGVHFEVLETANTFAEIRRALN
jgi:CBS domain-containing protein